MVSLNMRYLFNTIILIGKYIIVVVIFQESGKTSMLRFESRTLAQALKALPNQIPKQIGLTYINTYIHIYTLHTHTHMYSRQ